MCSRDGVNGKKSEAGGRRRPSADRIRDRNGYRQRASAFCARIALPLEHNDGSSAVLPLLNNRWPPNLGGLEVLMVSGRTAGESYWVLPGGGVENMESTEQAVIRELREEAGILGKVLFHVGEFIDDQRFHHTTLFFLSVVEMFTEWGENFENGRQRRWMRMDEARGSIKHTQREMLEQSIKIIERTLGERLEPAVITCLLTTPIISPRADSPELGTQQSVKKLYNNHATVTVEASIQLPRLANGTGYASKTDQTSNGHSLR